MNNTSSEVRHVVAWLQPARWITCVALWAVLAVVWLFPHLDLSLRSIGVLGLAAAICRTIVVVTYQRHGAPPAFLGLAFASDAVLLTGLLDITGGPFNPFIVQPADDAQAPSLARIEWEHIQRILADCDGNVSHAARVLGIHRRSLQRKLAKRPASR